LRLAALLLSTIALTTIALAEEPLAFKTLKLTVDRADDQPPRRFTPVFSGSHASFPFDKRPAERTDVLTIEADGKATLQLGADGPTYTSRVTTAELEHLQKKVRHWAPGVVEKKPLEKDPGAGLPTPPADVPLRMDLDLGSRTIVSELERVRGTRKNVLATSVDGQLVEVNGGETSRSVDLISDLNDITRDIVVRLEAEAKDPLPAAGFKSLEIKSGDGKNEQRLEVAPDGWVTVKKKTKDCWELLRDGKLSAKEMKALNEAVAKGRPDTTSSTALELDAATDPDQNGPILAALNAARDRLHGAPWPVANTGIIDRLQGKEKP
jgi:hypothetical protein